MNRFKYMGILAGLPLGLALTAAFQQSSSAATGDAAELSSAVSTSQVTLHGTISMRALAASEANRQALEAHVNVSTIAQPVHRLPDGSLTSHPRSSALASMAHISEPSAYVTAHVPGASTVTSIRGFTGVVEGDNVTANGYELEPPDQGFAVHNGVAAEIVNNVVRFFDSTSGAALTAPIATTTLFDLDPTVYNLSDTQVFFDPTSKRWYFTEIAFNATVNAFAIAVSQTSDPLGSYYVYLADAFSSAVPGCGGIDCFPDYPKGGYNADAIFVTADMFSNVSGQFVEAAIYAFPKLSLEAGKSFTYVRFDDPNDFVLQPSVAAPGEPFVTTREGGEYFMSAPTALFGFGPPRLSVLAVVGTRNIVSNPSALKGLKTTVYTKSYGNGTVPSSEPNVVGPYCSSIGVTSAPLIDAGYPTFQSTIQKVQGNLFGALAQGTIDGNGLSRDVITWFEVKPTLTNSGLTASVVKQANIVPPNGYSLSYPAFGFLESGKGVMAFTITNTDGTLPGGFPSAGLIQFGTSGPTSGIIVSGQGATSDDGFTGCGSPGPGTVGRWGDYGAAYADSATGYLYTASEMIPDASIYTRGHYANWGTFITQIH